MKYVLKMSGTFLAALAMGAIASGTASAQGTFGGLPTITPQGKAKVEQRRDTRLAARRLAPPRPSYVVVDKGGPSTDPRRASFESIQEAVDAVAWGGVVVVMPGVYHENVELKRSVVLQGDRGPGTGVRIMPKDDTKPCLSFAPVNFNDHAKVSNIDFEPAWRKTQPDRARAFEAGENYVEGLPTNSRFSGTPDFANNSFTSRPDAGQSEAPACVNVAGGFFTMVDSVVDGGGQHFGNLVSVSGGTALLEKNRLTGGSRGVSIHQNHALWDRALLIDNIVANNIFEGVHLAGEAPMLATGNLINANETGILYNGRGAATVVGNKILNNASHGVKLGSRANQVLVRLNQVWSNKGDGINIVNSSGLIEDNDIDGNTGDEISTIDRHDTIPVIINDVAENRPSPDSRNRDRRWFRVFRESNDGIRNGR